MESAKVVSTREGMVDDLWSVEGSRLDGNLQTWVAESVSFCEGTKETQYTSASEIEKICFNYG